MTSSKKIAGLVGPALIAVTLSESLNASIWASNIAPAIHLNGALLFVAGLAIIRSHHVWVRSWPVVVTLVGWLFIVIGLFRMFFPEFFLKGVQSTGYAFLIPTMGVLVIGIYLTYKAYSRERQDKE